MKKGGYYICHSKRDNSSGIEFITVSGEICFKYKGYQFFLHKDLLSTKWVVTELTSGCSVCSGKNKNRVIETAKKIIIQNKKILKEKVKEAYRLYGKAPDPAILTG